MQVIKKQLFIIAFLFEIWLLYLVFKVGCPIMSLTGFPCPTCGTMHALLALCKWDFNSYLNYQPMAVPLVLAVVLSMCVRLMRGMTKKVSIICVAIILLVNIGLYVSRIICLFC